MKIPKWFPWRALVLYVAMVAWLLLIAVPTSAEFSKLVPIGGGSPAKRLSDAMNTAGYTGSSALDELTLCVPSSNVNTMYVGSASNVNDTTGFPLEPGTCITYRAAGRPIESSSIYIYTATTESAAVSLRQR